MGEMEFLRQGQGSREALGERERASRGLDLNWRD